MVERGEFAEWAEVHGNRYGTTVDGGARRRSRAGATCSSTSTTRAAGSSRRKFENEAVLVFVLPPSLEELEARLRKRATDAPDVIERRLEKAHDELKQYGLYHYLIVNDELPRAYDRLRAIYLAAQCGDRSHGPRRRGAGQGGGAGATRVASRVGRCALRSSA